MSWPDGLEEYIIVHPYEGGHDIRITWRRGAHPLFAFDAAIAILERYDPSLIKGVAASPRRIAVETLGEWAGLSPVVEFALKLAKAPKPKQWLLVAALRGHGADTIPITTLVCNKCRKELSRRICEICGIPHCENCNCKCYVPKEVREPDFFSDEELRCILRRYYQARFPDVDFNQISPHNGIWPELLERALKYEERMFAPRPKVRRPEWWNFEAWERIAREQKEGKR